MNFVDFKFKDTFILLKIPKLKRFLPPVQHHPSSPSPLISSITNTYISPHPCEKFPYLCYAGVGPIYSASFAHLCTNQQTTRAPKNTSRGENRARTFDLGKWIIVRCCHAFYAKILLLPLLPLYFCDTFAAKFCHFPSSRKNRQSTWRQHEIALKVFFNLFSFHFD